MTIACTITLGRARLGADATEEAYDSWVAYVCHYVADAVPDIDVRVARRPADSEGQGDSFFGSDEECAVVSAAVDALWAPHCELEAAVRAHFAAKAANLDRRDF